MLHELSEDVSVHNSTVPPVTVAVNELPEMPQIGSVAGVVNLTEMEEGLEVLTVSFMISAAPVQPLAVGVTEYCSMPPAVLRKGCTIDEPQELVQLEAPVMEPERVDADQV